MKHGIKPHMIKNPVFTAVSPISKKHVALSSIVDSSEPSINGATCVDKTIPQWGVFSGAKNPYLYPFTVGLMHFPSYIQQVGNVNFKGKTPDGYLVSEKDTKIIVGVIDVYKPSTTNLLSIMSNLDRKITDYPYSKLFVNCIHIKEIMPQLQEAIDKSNLKGSVTLIDPSRDSLPSLFESHLEWERKMIDKFDLEKLEQLKDELVVKTVFESFSPKDHCFSTIDSNALKQHESGYKLEQTKDLSNAIFDPTVI
jgi:hypothetical protein